mgnify:CR=1 FL=1
MTTLILPTRDYHTLSVAERYRVIEAAQRVFGRTLPGDRRGIRHLMNIERYMAGLDLVVTR